MDAAQWPQQGIGLVKGAESSERRPQIQVERRARPQKEQALNCPRCDSTNTKFCYYNNYSLSQPRYFCKTCRRYWTEGGTLRNVPVGGGSRKNKRSSSSSSSSFSPSPSSTPTLAPSTTAAIAKTAIPPQPSRELDHLAYKLYQGGHDLNLSFQNRSLAGGHELGGGGPLSALELLRSGISTAALGGSFVPMPPAPGSLFGAGFGFQEFMRPVNGSIQDAGDGRLRFPFEDSKHVQLVNESHEAPQGQGDPTLFWNSVMGGNGNRGAGGSW